MTFIWLALSVFLIGGYIFWRWNTQENIVTINAAIADNFPDKGFSHQSFNRLLNQFVNKKGKIDYPVWHQDQSARIALDQYLAAVAAYSPENTPQRFKNSNDRLAYWVYAYNALVIKSILDHWPISSVTDLKAPVEMVQGLGFFYKRKFIFGGKAYSLYQIENLKIFNGQGDPRIHFILNCGSQSCPAMRPQLPVGDALQPFLQSSARNFVADKKNVRINHAKKIIYLSSIFKWYKSDFINAVKTREQPATLIDYLQTIADQSINQELEKAKSYKIDYISYDWSVNQTSETNKDE